MHRLSFFMIVACLIGLAACATPYGLYADKRPLETQKSDTGLRSQVGSALKAAGFTGVSEMTVHVYYGRVFLTGEVPEKQRGTAVRTAQQVEGVADVTPHWFISLKSDSESDAALRLRLEKNLVAADGVTSSRVDHVVNSGRVVLLGVVESEAERQAAITTARKTAGARSVASYLFVRVPKSAPLEQPAPAKKAAPAPKAEPELAPLET